MPSPFIVIKAQRIRVSPVSPPATLGIELQHLSTTFHLQHHFWDSTTTKSFALSARCRRYHPAISLRIRLELCRFVSCPAAVSLEANEKKNTRIIVVSPSHTSIYDFRFIESKGNKSSQREGPEDRRTIMPREREVDL